MSLSTDASIEHMEQLLATDLNADLLEHAAATLEDLKTVSHCCAHLTHLIDDVLLLSKMGESMSSFLQCPSDPMQVQTTTSWSSPRSLRALPSLSSVPWPCSLARCLARRSPALSKSRPTSRNTKSTLFSQTQPEYLSSSSTYSPTRLR